MALTLDWSTVSLSAGDGSTTVTSGGDTVTIDITGNGGLSTANFGVGEYYNPVSNTPAPDTTTLEFSSPVENLTFELFDVDQYNGSWDDMIEIVALDASGAQVPVTFSDLSHHTVDGNKVEGGAAADAGGTGSQDAVTVTIPGAITELNIIFRAGTSTTSSNHGASGYGDMTFDVAAPPCFTTGMKIKTERGAVAVENLVPGDMIWTLDNGFQPLRYLFQSTCVAVGTMRPIVFEAGSIGNDEPLVVSQRHRMFVKTLPYEVRKVFRQYQDNLVQALALVNGKTIRVAKEYEEITYFHMMMDDHQLVHCHGTYSESWQPTKSALKASPEVAAELLEVFPNLAERRSFMKGALVRHELKIEDSFYERNPHF